MQAESSDVGSHGTIYAFTGRLLTRITDPTGRVHAELTWDASDALARLVVADGAIVLDGRVIQHPLLGPAHRLGDTAVSAIDWARPTEIPAIAEPGRLPPGAGGAILNALAVLAKRAYVPALRYAGPYPTPALWRSLLRSFRTTGDEASFTADALDRMLRVARDPIPIDFAPAPHERVAFDRGYAELRGGIDGRGLPPAGSAAEWLRGGIDGRGMPPAGSAAEWLRGTIDRAVLDGISYEPDGSPARLVHASDGSATCEVWFGDAIYADVATIGDDGALREARPLPPCESAMIGRDFPPPLRAALAELVAEAVPRPLADEARGLLAGKPILWTDLGARAASMTDDGSFLVHAALWDRIAPLGLARLALALTEALAPVVTLAALLRTSPHV